LDLGSKSQQILTLAGARLIYDFQPLAAKARATPVDFSHALDLKPVRRRSRKLEKPKIYLPHSNPQPIFLLGAVRAFGLG
jgi:hypothetical protein